MEVAGETSKSAITMSVGGRSMVAEVKNEPEYYKGMGKENLNVSTDVEIYICQAGNLFSPQRRAKYWRSAQYQHLKHSWTVCWNMEQNQMFHCIVIRSSTTQFTYLLFTLSCSCLP